MSVQLKKVRLLFIYVEKNIIKKFKVDGSKPPNSAPPTRFGIKHVKENYNSVEISK